MDKRGESSDLSVGSRDYGEPVKEPKNELRGSFTSESKENAPSIDPDREVYIVLDEASEGTPECIQCNCADCIVKDIFRQRSPPPKAYLQKLSSQPIANMQEIDQRLEVTPGQKKVSLSSGTNYNLRKWMLPINVTAILNNFKIKSVSSFV